MKIYAASREYPLDRFIGKDLWVLCEQYWGGHFFRPGIVYVRVIAKGHDGYKVNVVPKFTVDDFKGCGLKVLLNTLAGSHYVRFDDIKIRMPIEVITTSEMLPEELGVDDPYAEDIAYFSKYVGKDAWVRAKHWGCGGDIFAGVYYIHILSLEGTVMTYNQVGGDWVDMMKRSKIYDDDDVRQLITFNHVESVGDWHAIPISKKPYTTAQIYKRLKLEQP